MLKFNGGNLKGTLRIGTRGSALAMKQTEMIAGMLKNRYHELLVETIVIKTQGDILDNISLLVIGGKGVFVKELEDALLSGEVDIAVHSLKDMPAQIPDGLEISAILQREDARDVLISKDNKKLERMPRKARIGTGSMRRSCQLENNLPGIEIVPIRGNIDTRIRKGKEGDLDGVILAAAGIKRMGWESVISQFIPIETMLPAVGQGAICIEQKTGRAELKNVLAFLNDATSAIEVGAERAFLLEMGGGCRLPLAAYAKIKNDILTIKGIVGAVKGGELIKDELQGSLTDAGKMGTQLAQQLLNAGGYAFLADARKYFLE
ncbi:MAG: hydroxymethylbilane synthase [Deltaproteobacteria bacterium]